MKKLGLLLWLLSQCWLISNAQQTVGLFLNDSLSQNGYTLFSNNKTTYLVDNCGFVVNTWTSNFTTNSGLYLLENGNLLRSCRIGGSFTGGGVGGRIELFSWEGDLLWASNYANAEHQQHHDIHPLPNGNFLILAWEAHTFAEAIQAGRNPDLLTSAGLWPEQIVEAEMVGTNEINIVWEWRLWDHLVQDFDTGKDNYGPIAEHPELVNINYTSNLGGNNADWIHANGIAYNPELDQVALSSRVFSEIWIIDHSTTSGEAASHSGGNAGKGGDILYRWGNPDAYGRGGPGKRTLWGQHNINWIPAGYPNEGKLIVFNNGIGRPGGNFSSADIWQPPTDVEGNYFIENGQPFGPAGPAWSYAAPGFYSANVSSAHGLPNGNIFICEGQDSRFFEVTPEKQLVWEYLNPSTNFGPVAQGQTTSASTFRATRYPADYPAFAGKDLTPGPPVELNPLPSDCVIFDGTPPVSVWPARVLEDVWLRNNPVQRSIFIENQTSGELTLEILTAAGLPVKSKTATGFEVEMNVSNLPAGLYLLRISDAQRSRFSIQKFIKN